MKIIYHPRFTDSDYSDDPAAEEGRILSVLDEIEKERSFEIYKPSPASREEIELVHTKEHVQSIKDRSGELYEMAKLAVAASISASRSAHQGEPSFAVIRPPGHHASPDSCWGFCYFNNMAVAIENLRRSSEMESAFIMDFDLHTGDGNINCLGDDGDIDIVNPRRGDRKRYMEEVESVLNRGDEYDIVGVSAGFDLHRDDWGGKLMTEDYRLLGEMLKDFSESKCEGRRFALLEGGYNHQVLGKNVFEFIQGFSD